MNFKKILDRFAWKPEHEYSFSLPDTDKEQSVSYIPDKDLNMPKIVFPSISKNLDYIKVRFNTLINTDIVIREFIVDVESKQYKAFLLFIDGMINSNLISDFILKPLMKEKNNPFYQSKQARPISKENPNRITVKKVKKFNLAEYIFNCLIPQNSVSKKSNFDEIASSVNSGNCILFIDTLEIAFDIDVKGFNQRSVEAPNNEVVIKGPQEAFVENIRTNTSLLRRIINNENLIIENVELGALTKTKCAICYIENIANSDLVAEVKYRINNLDVDSLPSSGLLEELITDGNQIGVPEVISTERPDKTCKYLLQGRVAVLLNGEPYCLVMPATLVDFLSSPEDTNLKPYFSNFLRILRFTSAFITLFLPGLYVAITSFHQEILPTELLFSILGARETVPFPVIFEIIIMEVSFELIREARIKSSFAYWSYNSV